MPMDNSPDIGEADAGAFKLIVPVEALKNTEEFVHILHIESYPIITDEHLDFNGALSNDADLDLGLWPCRCKFQRIGDQIHEHLAQHGRIS
jgi:hypothetical protein